MAQQYPYLIIALASLALGFLIGTIFFWLISRGRIDSARNEAKSEAEVKLAQLSERASRVVTLESALAEITNKLHLATNETAALTVQSESFSRETERLKIELVGLKSSNEFLIKERDDLNLQVATLNMTVRAKEESLSFKEDAKTELGLAFKSLASEILDEKTLKFTEQNKTNLNQVLDPLKSKITEFTTKVETMSQDNSTGRALLQDHVIRLDALYKQVSDDTSNLASALKGSIRTQGNWGEMILERVLEVSGLQKGREYELRESYVREDGGRSIPDVVINLPQSRHLVIDAKVSLTDYDRSINATEESDREEAAARHVQSVRRHIKELSERNYQDLHALKTLDFVVMFVPIEPAFSTALAADRNLWESAFKKNILLVSPSNLLFVLRTVAVLWRQEEQARNVREIAKRGAELYNKLVGFVEEMQKIGRGLRQAQESFDDATRKLSTGQGNVIRQAEMLKKLGIRPTKTLPQGMLEEAMQESLILQDSLLSEGDNTDAEDSPSANMRFPEEEIPF